MYHSGQDDLNAIVADIGSFSTRIGHAGEDTPKAYIHMVRITFTFDQLGELSAVAQHLCC
jgi:actin-related protein